MGKAQVTLLAGSRRRARGLRAVAVLLGVLAASGCSGADGNASSSPRVPVTSTSPTISATATATADATAAAGEAALKAYRGFRKAQVAAEATADPRHRGLAKYAGDKALAQERANLRQLAEAGIVVTGKPLFSPEVADVSLGDSPVVTITDCVDTTDWTPVYEATGKSAAAPGQPMRVKATALARPYGQGWVITELKTDRSRPC